VITARLGEIWCEARVGEPRFLLVMSSWWHWKNCEHGTALDIVRYLHSYRVILGLVPIFSPSVVFTTPLVVESVNNSPVFALKAMT
jgi:hypothetical protein